MIGYINKIETMGLVDGPGVRVVVFLQGCKARCLFCHNPETWQIGLGKKISPEELTNLILRYKNYFGKNGGVTFSGGEPLLQKEFLVEVCKLCKQHQIHICLDTSGIGENYEELLSYVDLILLDVKALTNETYIKICAQPIFYLKKFLEVNRKPIWIRQVIIPGINDTEEYIISLKKILEPYSTIQKIELLPYHTMGVSKYQEMNLPYRLIGVSAMNQEKLIKLQELLS